MSIDIVPRSVRKIRRKSTLSFICGLCALVTVYFVSSNNLLSGDAWVPSNERHPRTGHNNRDLQHFLVRGSSGQRQLEWTNKSYRRTSSHKLFNGENPTSTTDLELVKGWSSSDSLYLTEPDKGRRRRLPRAIIIGVKKGGTRALLEFLRVHPDVKATGPEPHFFDKHYHKGLDWYRSLMPETLPHQITIEKTPSYFVTSEVPSRIFKMSNSTKLVLVVRDPVTRAVSDYTQILSKHGKSKSFQSSAFLRNDTSRINTSWIVIRIGLYVKHLENWLSVFPLRQIHFVHGENLVTNPGEEMRKVQEFLGLEPVITEKHFFFDKRRGFPCIKKKLTNKRGHCLDESKGRPHPLLPAKVISSLRRFYRPFNEKFYKLTNIDFKWP
ncbi:heparan sulfate glucosamine 3-O-sulfotransferase 6-like [Crassostrea virginica]